MNEFQNSVIWCPVVPKCLEYNSNIAFSDVPGNFAVFMELLLYLPSITCDKTGKVAREVEEIGP